MKQIISSARRLTMAQFFMSGATFATWGVQIPAIKARFGVTDAVMSMAMLCVAAGAVLALSRVGRWVARAGAGAALQVSGVVLALALAAIPWVPWFGVLLLVLLVFGMAMAAFDVAMNVQAADIERTDERPIMSTVHGMFSLGGMVGAALGGLLLTAGMSLEAHAALFAVALAAAGLYSARVRLAHHASPDEKTAQARGHRRIPPQLWVLGIVAFLGLVCEGAMYDWAAIYMRDVAALALARSGYGYAAFSLGMALGRFSADPVRKRVRAKTILIFSAWLGVLGIAIAVAVPLPWPALAGFFLMGLGVANLMPFFFLAGANLPGMSAAEGVAGVARFAYAGMLFGPPIIGAITHLGTLRLGLAAIALTMVWIATRGIGRIAPYVK
jgi:fucose permease